MFERRFETNIAEKKPSVVVVEDVATGTLQKLLEFAYTGEVTDMTKSLELLYAANNYNMVELVRYKQIQLLSQY